METQASTSRLILSPNPARGRVAVRGGARPGAPVRVEVFGLLGRRVVTLHDGVAAGTYTFDLDASVLTPGTYVVRAVAGTAVETARLVVR